MKLHLILFWLLIAVPTALGAPGDDRTLVGSKINVSGNIITLPTSDGTDGQCVKTDGLGVWSFDDCGGGTLANNTFITARNFTNSGDINLIKASTSNEVAIGGNRGIYIFEENSGVAGGWTAHLHGNDTDNSVPGGELHLRQGNGDDGMGGYQNGSRIDLGTNQVLIRSYETPTSSSPISIETTSKASWGGISVSGGSVTVNGHADTNVYGSDIEIKGQSTGDAALHLQPGYVSLYVDGGDSNTGTIDIGATEINIYGEWSGGSTSTVFKFWDAFSNNFVAIKAPNALSGDDVTFTLPSEDGDNGDVLTTDGSGNWSFQPAGGGGSPGGSDTQVQFNDGGSSFGGDSGLVFNKTTNALTVDGAITTSGSNDSFRIKAGNTIADPGLLIFTDSTDVVFQTLAGDDVTPVPWNLHASQVILNSDQATFKLRTNGNDAVNISTAGAVKFSQYGAGVLTSDGSGNITAVSQNSWTSCTLTATWTTNTTVTGFCRRSNDSLDVKGRVELSGAPDATDLRITLPATFCSGSQCTIDTAKLTSANNGLSIIGTSRCLAIDTGTNNYVCSSMYNNTTRFYLMRQVQNASDVENSAGITNTTPFTFGNTDAVEFEVHGIPIVGW